MTVPSSSRISSSGSGLGTSELDARFLVGLVLVVPDDDGGLGDGFDLCGASELWALDAWASVSKSCA